MVFLGVDDADSFLRNRSIAQSLELHATNGTNLTAEASALVVELAAGGNRRIEARFSILFSIHLFRAS